MLTYWAFEMSGKSEKFNEQAANFLSGRGRNGLFRDPSEIDPGVLPRPSGTSPSESVNPMPANTNFPSSQDEGKGGAVVSSDNKDGTGNEQDDASTLKLVPQTDNLTREEVLEKINALIGMDDFKSWVNDLDQGHEFERVAKKLNLAAKGDGKKNSKFYHMVLVGDPGTGKSMAAEMYCQYLRSSERMKDAHFYKVTVGDIVSQYVGATSRELKKVLSQGKKEGQKLIIHVDEAYILSSNSHGREAIAELVGSMTEEADRIAIVLTGYKGPMSDMLSSNEGMRSRVRVYIECKNYSDQDLLGILKLKIPSEQYQRKLSGDAAEEAVKAFAAVREAAGKHFGNGRVAEVLLMNMGLALERRVSGMVKDLKDEHIDVMSEAERSNLETTMMTYTADDVRNAVRHMMTQALDHQGETSGPSTAEPDKLRPIVEQVVMDILGAAMAATPAPTDNTHHLPRSAGPRISPP